MRSSIFIAGVMIADAINKGTYHFQDSVCTTMAIFLTAFVIADLADFIKGMIE
jgi:hypothetical protein